MLYSLIGILVIIIIILVINLQKKVNLDTTKIQNYNDLLISCSQLKITNENLTQEINTHILQLEDYQKKIKQVQDEYTNALYKKEEELNNYFSRQKDNQDIKLAELWEEKQKSLSLREQAAIEKSQERLNEFKSLVATSIAEGEMQRKEIQNQVNFERKRYEAILAPLEQYEKDKQEKLYYTIQLPDEYKPDIAFLLNTVAQKIQHPDIINKLIWNEYVKPYLTATFTRVGIEHVPGIYKITNLNNGKSYIGKSTDVRKRLTDHFKSSVGIKTISDQAIHHEIWKDGFWNWTIEIITTCEKEKLNELEKFYIETFETNRFGYNKTTGGEG